MTQPHDDSPDDILILAELSEPAAPASSPPKPTVPVERDRWYVQQQNGRQSGPFTWVELLGCVKAKMFFADDQAHGEANSTRVFLRDLFPSLAERNPGPQVDPTAPLSQQLSQSPVETVVFGPEVGAYQKLDPTGIHYASNLRKILLLGVFFLAAWIGAWIAVFLGFPAKDRPVGIVMTGIAGFSFLMGLLQFSAALLEWESIFNLRKIRWWRAMYGDVAARNYLLYISWIPIGVSVLLVITVLSIAMG